MHWLKYVRLNRKDLLKNIHGTTVEVAMLAYVRGAYSAISSVNQCVIGPLWHEPTPLGYTWLWFVKKTLMERHLNIDYLLWIMS